MSKYHQMELYVEMPEGESVCDDSPSGSCQIDSSGRMGRFSELLTSRFTDETAQINGEGYEGYHRNFGIELTHSRHLPIVFRHIVECLEQVFDDIPCFNFYYTTGDEE